ANASFRSALRGRILRADGQPLAEALVQLRSDDYSGLLPSAITGEDGQYELTRLPAGTFTVSASRAGFITVEYGQRRAFGPGEAIELGAGDTRAGVDLVMPQPGAVSGQILDDGG